MYAEHAAPGFRAFRYVANRVDHNSHLLVIQKRSTPLPPLQINFKRVANGMRVQDERLTQE